MSTKPPYPYPDIRHLVRIALSVLWVGPLLEALGLRRITPFRERTIASQRFTPPDWW